MAYQAGPFSWTAVVSERSDSDMRVSPTRTRPCLHFVRFPAYNAPVEPAAFMPALL
jgi:hypothetical protein